MSIISINESCNRLQRGEIIAYPTESVFGLGCLATNLQAVKVLALLKNRSLDKGFVILVDNLNTIKSWIDLKQIEQAHLDKMYESWPGPYTWLIPASTNCPLLLKGKYKSLAVRISKHPVCQEITKKVSPIVSTSANFSTHPPATTPSLVNQYFKDINITEGELGKQSKTSRIIDLQTLTLIRK